VALALAGGSSGVALADDDVGIAAPDVGAVTIPVDPVEVNQLIDFSGAFTDPSPVGGTFTAVWNWGDGSTSQGVVTPIAGSLMFSVTASHDFSNAGVFEVELTVKRLDDGSSDTSDPAFMVVYDPEGGFVTGGGWIDSPAGAYVADPSLAGKATFGFVSRYKKGASEPDGNTQFQFKAGDLNFHSNRYDWLVVAGHKAMYKGMGTVNGAGNYGFLLSVIDADLTPSVEVDRFRIKIWDKDDGDTVVYDNQRGDPDDADASTSIGGGSIVIHKGKGKQ
jgi:hypothetical protein